MRGIAIRYWLAALLLLIGLGGCGGGGDDTGTGAGALTISGRVTDITGVTGVSAATVQLFRDGTAFGAATQTDATGNFTFSGAPADTYILQVTRAGASPLIRTLYGPVVVTQDVMNVAVQAFTQSDFEAQTGVAPPPDSTTGKIVVVGLTNTGELVNTTVTVAGSAPVGPAAPAEVSVAPGAYAVTVTGNGSTAILPGVPVVGGDITLLAVPLDAPAATAFTVTGAVVSAFSGAPLTAITVQLFQAGNQVGDAYTTLADGTFLYEDVPAGTDYTLRATATGYADAVFGPFAVNFDRRGVLIPVASLAELQANEGIAPPADNTTATLVIYATDAQSAAFNPTISLNGGAPFTDPTVPVVRADLAPGTYDIAITDPVTTNSATIQDVQLIGGRITVIQARTGLNNMP
jgi:hypothetical protein